MLPGIVKFLLRSAVIGILIGVAVAVLFIAVDTAGIGALIRGSETPLAPIALFISGFAILFGSVFTGGAIMLLPANADADVWRKMRDEPRHQRSSNAQ